MVLVVLSMSTVVFPKVMLSLVSAWTSSCPFGLVRLLLNLLSVFVALLMMPLWKPKIEIFILPSCNCKLLSPSLRSSPLYLVSCQMSLNALLGPPANVVVRLLPLFACLEMSSSRSIMPKTLVVKLSILALLAIPCCKLVFAKLAKLLFVFGVRLWILKINVNLSLVLLPALPSMVLKLVLSVTVPFVPFAVLRLRPFGVFSVAFVPCMLCCCCFPKAIWLILFKLRFANRFWPFSVACALIVWLQIRGKLGGTLLPFALLVLVVLLPCCGLCCLVSIGRGSLLGPFAPSSSAVASWYCWHSETKSFMLDSASVNSISSIPSPVYQCRKALRRNIAVKYSATRLNISSLSQEKREQEKHKGLSKNLWADWADCHPIQS